MDDVYATYHVIKVFGQAINNSSKLANPVLSYMIVCMFIGPKFYASYCSPKMYGDFTADLNQDGLDRLRDFVCQWVIHRYFMLIIPTENLLQNFKNNFEFI